jgi:thiol-disulfide isomerase/thioredoxin
MRITNKFNHYALLGAAAILLCYAIARAEDNLRSDVSAGQKAPAFQAQTLDGKTVNFPGDYKGKVVLLDFWATWCVPCRLELPNVVATYKKYHDKGLEILSVSLNEAQQKPAILKFIHDHNVTWPQIYDGGYWKAAVALQYGVKGIPCPILVDGDTGVIIAQGDDVVGAKLSEQVKTSLAAKAKK